MESGSRLVSFEDYAASARYLMLGRGAAHRRFVVKTSSGHRPAPIRLLLAPIRYDKADGLIINADVSQ
jgi:hypothetical protein